MRSAALICGLVALATVAGASVLTHTASGRNSASSVACPDYYVVDSRGSGEEGGTISPPGAKLVSALRADLPGKTVKALPNGYPARGGYSILAGAKLKVPGAYFNSVNSGKAWLADAVPKLSKQCSDARIVLTGYSQGAQVTADVVQQDGPLKGVVAVVLFGDPYFNGSDGRADQGNYRAGVDGGLGRRRKFVGVRVYSYCHSNDPVCQSTANPIALTTWHNNYDKLGEPEEAARAVALLASGSAVAGTSAPIVFAAGRAGELPAIYTTAPDGHNITRLTSGAEWDGDPVWSPNGSRILFASTRGYPISPTLNGPSEIWVMKPDGTQRQRITSNHQSLAIPEWSPDGKRISYCACNGNFSSVWISNVDGTSAFQATSAFASQLAWSPDSRHVSIIRIDSNFRRHLDVLSAQLDGEKEIKLTVAELGNKADWSPDGDQLAFTAAKSVAGGLLVWNVWIANIGTGIVSQVTHLDGAHSATSNVAWSPDGKRLAIAELASGDRSYIDVVNVKDGRVSRINVDRRLGHNRTVVLGLDW